MDTDPIEHQQLSHVLAQSRLGVGASELHGSLSGYLCGGGVATADSWPSALMLDNGEGDWPNDAIFSHLYRDCHAQLEDSDLGFEPLLPEDATPLPQRAEALVEWCRGFLGGLGLAGVGSRGELSGDASEILRDLATIAASRLDYAETEEDEYALNEVREFVRVGALLLHGELAPPPQAGRAPHGTRLH